MNAPEHDAPVDAEERLAALQRATGRVRLLGAVAGGVVHELANRLGAVLGYAEHLAARLDGPDREQLAALVGAAGESASLLRTVVQMLEPGRPAGIVALPALCADAVALLHKHGARGGRVVQLEAPPSGDRPRVRAVLADALHAVVASLLFAVRTGSGPLDVAVERRPGRAPACIRIRDRGGPEPLLALAALLGAPAAGQGAVHAAVPDGGADLVAAAFWLRRCGGDLEACVLPGGERELVLRWPELRA